MEITGDTRGTRYYINTNGTNGTDQAAPSVEQVAALAGLESESSMVVIDREDSIGGLLGIEVLMPTRIVRNGTDDACDLEFQVGTPAPGTSLVTIENGVAFDGSDYGQYEGIEVDYTPDQQMVAIRVENTPLSRIHD